MKIQSNVIVCVFLTVPCALVFLEKEKNVGREFEVHQIVPDIIPVAPIAYLNITYPNGIKIDLGTRLSAANVSRIPNVYWAHTPDSYYVLYMSDIDSPERQDPKFREWHLWLVVNIPGCNVDQGDTLTEFIPIIPCAESGFHRYVFLVYEQDNKMAFKEKHISNRTGVRRPEFSIHDFAKKYDLGHPIAGNFFLGEFDYSVTKTYEQLNDTMDYDGGLTDEYKDYKDLANKIKF